MDDKTGYAEVPKEFEEIISAGPFPIRFPTTGGLSQDKEWCEVLIEGKWRKIRFHDYADVYEIPGLYETIFYRTLRCNSPTRVVGLLNEVLNEHGILPENLRALDFGAGNGMAGEALQTIGARHIVGVDILPQAREATLRDRPWVYSDYIVKDFLRLSKSDLRFFKEYRFNSLLIVAALGFGDIPPIAFSNAFNLVENEGWLAFNVKEDFLHDDSRSGFSGLLRDMIRNRVIRVELYKRYRHRLNVEGLPIYYTAIVAKKLHDLDLSDVMRT